MRRLLLVVLLFLVAAHLGWWYWPRQHRGRPAGTTGALLTSPEYDEAFWIAYPHQNLSRLQSAAGDLETLTGRVALLLDAEAPEWPRFGPWSVPPARAIAWARAAEGGSDLVALDLYPTVATLARMAGRLAGNPWLAGGEIDRGRERLRVSWRRSTWVLERGAAPLAAEVETAGTPFDPELAWIRLGPDRAPLPAGRYRLRVRAGELELTSGPPIGFRLESVVERLGTRMVLLAVAASPGGHGAAALLRPRRNQTGLGLPSAVLAERGESGLELPGERLLRRLGTRPRTRRLEDLEIRSWDREGLDMGEELATAFEATLAAEPALRLAAWADLEEVAVWATTLGRTLEAVPFIDPAPARRWLALGELAAACGPGATLWLELRDDPAAARFLLKR